MLVVMTGAVSVRAATVYVATNSIANGPGTAWANAFRTIQAAVDVAVSGDTVLVTNGVYVTGGAVTPDYELTNRVCITKGITVLSVNGPSKTFIVGAGPQGPGAIRCVYMTAGIVSGFTLTNGNTQISEDGLYNQNGGGAFLRTGGTLSNCVLSGCSAYSRGGGAMCNSGGTLNNCTISGNSVTGTGNGGGGVYCLDAGTLNNCLITGNQARSWGGGVFCYRGGTLNNCTLSGNTADYSGGGGAFLWDGGTLNNCTLSGNTAAHTGKGGGAYCNTGGTLNNCTLSGNTAASSSGVYAYGGGALVNCIVSGNSPGGTQNIGGTSGYTIQYTCSPGLNGSGNMTNDPQFVSAPAGNYRLSANSPCINTGTNQAWMTGKTDLDGNPRIITGTVDMGAYETVVPPGNALSFNGTSQSANIGHGTSLDVGNTLTVEAWVKPINFFQFLSYIYQRTPDLIKKQRII